MSVVDLNEPLRELVRNRQHVGVRGNGDDSLTLEVAGDASATTGALNGARITGPRHTSGSSSPCPGKPLCGSVPVWVPEDITGTTATVLTSGSLAARKYAVQLG